MCVTCNGDEEALLFDMLGVLLSNREDDEVLPWKSVDIHGTKRMNPKIFAIPDHSNIIHH